MEGDEIFKEQEEYILETVYEFFSGNLSYRDFNAQMKRYKEEINECWKQQSLIDEYDPFNGRGPGFHGNNMYNQDY